MKTRITLLLCLCMLCACGPHYVEPTPPTPQPEDETGKVANAHFEYDMVGFQAVNIKDESSGVEVIYDFGDGTKTTYKLPYNYLIFHSYKELGTYTITAQAIGANGSVKTYTQSVVIREPDVYVTAIKYIAVDVETDYYKAKLVDDDFFTTTWINTDYTPMLTKTILPYTYKLKNPVKMDGLADDDYYTLYIYHNTKNSGNGTQCLKQNIPTKSFQIPSVPYIEVKNNSKNTVVQLLLEFK